MLQFPLYIFDLDGTLFRGNEPTPSAPDVLASLRQMGAQVRFLTNNSSRTREDIARKLQEMSFECDSSEIYTSAMGAGKWCAARELRNVFVFGEEGLRQTLLTYDLNIVEDQPQAVIAGICRSLTYDLLTQTMNHIRNGATFVATNRDATYPVEGGRLEPGSGSTVSALETCSSVVPEVIGKPNPFLIRWILEEAQVPPQSAIVVGDRYDTDIAAGIAAGCPTHMVLCGVTREAPYGQSASPDLRGLL